MRLIGNQGYMGSAKRQGTADAGFRPGADHSLPPWSGVGPRPRSFTLMPCALAHSRTAVLSSPPAGARRPPRAGRRGLTPIFTKRPGLLVWGSYALAAGDEAAPPGVAIALQHARRP